jgi:L-lysine exporter family protein LysE/ArgO
MASAQAYISGLGLGASLIMAIGAQNAHVLRMGIQRRHVALTVAMCILIDIVLIALGVAGAGAMIHDSPALLAAARWGGAVFLLGYGLRSWRSALQPRRLDAADGETAQTAGVALAAVLGMSLLNPHVYLDTVVLLGSVGGRYPAVDRSAFSAGAMTASTLWFCILGFGAARFAGILSRPAVWKAIELATGGIMLALAVTLMLEH